MFSSRMNIHESILEIHRSCQKVTALVCNSSSFILVMQRYSSRCYEKSGRVVKKWSLLKISLQEWTYKDKSPKVPFQRINLSYSYFEEFEFSRQFSRPTIQQKAKHDQEKISAEQKLKVCWQSPAMFCLFTHQAKIQICCTVKLIPWNVVNLSHLYS